VTFGDIREVVLNRQGPPPDGFEIDLLIIAGLHQLYKADLIDHWHDTRTNKQGRAIQFKRYFRKMPAVAPIEKGRKRPLVADLPSNVVSLAAERQKRRA
jgi:hypothetical protein